MGLAARLKAAYRTLTRDDFEMLGLLQPPVAAGVPVSQSTALTISSFWCGVNVISGDIGLLDRHLYKRVGDNDDRERATAHPVYKVVHDAPNPYMTPMVFWQTLQAHALTWGGGFAEIEWDKAMRPLALWPIMPNEIEPRAEMVNGRPVVYYLWRGQQRIAAEDVIHVPGLGFDGVRGYSVVHMARENLGRTMAVERFGASFFGNGAWPGLALEHSGNLSPEAQKRLRDSIEARHQGANKAHRLIVLEEGMKISKPLTVSPDDAQFLGTTEAGIEDVARWLNLPPSKLKHKMGERPGGNLEASQLEYLMGSLLPWTTRIEQELNSKLISQSQRGTYYVEHLFAKQLKADSLTRAQIQKIYVDMGVMTAEQVARQENLPKPPAKPEPAPAAKQAPDPAPQPATDSVATPGERAIVARTAPALRALLLDRLSSYVRRQADRTRQAAAKGPDTFGAWVDGFCARELGVLLDVVVPVARVGLAATGSLDDAAAVLEGSLRAHVDRSREELLSLPAKELAFAADRLAKRWESSRAVELADAVMALVAEEKTHA
jgi:HK97 family phage portal protein